MCKKNYRLPILSLIQKALKVIGFTQKDIKVTTTQIINKCVQIVSNQDQIKIRLSVKNVVAMNFTGSVIKVYHL